MGGAVLHINDKAGIDLDGLDIINHPVTIDDELVCHRVSPWDEDRERLKAIGLAGEVKRPAWCRQRCGGEENGKDRRQSEIPVSMRGMSGMKNKKEAMGRLAWSKVPVTITSLASVCGMLAGPRTEHGNQEWRRTIGQ
jgi:hypothetical protein